MAGESLSNNNQAPNENPWDELSTYDKMTNQALTRAVMESQAKVKALNENLDAKREEAAIEKQDLEQAVEQAALPAHEAITALPPHEETNLAPLSGTVLEPLGREEIDNNIIIDIPNLAESEASLKAENEQLALPPHEEEVKATDEDEAKKQGEAMQAFLDLQESEDKAAAEKRLREEEEQRTREEEEQRAREEEEEKNRPKTREEIDAEIAAIDRELASLNDPLVAINADFTHDAKEIAHDVAKTAFDEKTAKVNFIRKIWRNTFEKAYVKNYEKKFLSGEMTDENGMNLDQRLAAQRAATMERFTLGATESMEYIHTNIGIRNVEGKADGEKLTEADKETTAKVRSAIEAFFKEYKEKSPNMTDAELTREFNNMFKRLSAEDKDNGGTGQKLINNYGDVALTALKTYEHIEGLQAAMERFKVYNADVRNNVRTEAHRDNLDKAINALESSKIGRFVPAEALAAAAGLSTLFTQTGLKAVAGAAGGIVGSGIIAGLRERNRITEDRATKLRNLAYGMEYTSGTEETGSGAVDRRLRKSAEYEAKIGGTIYPLEKATTLTSNLEAALALPDDEPGRAQAIKEAITAASVRVEYSDQQQKDLISFSSADKTGDERLALDKALIRARRALSEEDRADLAAMQSELMKNITEDYENANDEFAKLRSRLVRKKAISTMLVGTANYFVSQEAIAAISPSKIGIFEKAGLLKTENNEDAQETILASVWGGRGSYNAITNTYTSEAIETSDPAVRARLEAEGYQGTEISAGSTSTVKDFVDVAPSDSPSGLRVSYDGWANNGTKAYDGNELRAQIIDGKLVSTMRGNSTMNGQTFSYEDLAAAGRMKGYLTIGGAKFEVQSALDEAGRITWGENGVFTVIGPDGTTSTIQALGENGEKLYKYFEIAMDNGVDADGIQHIVPFATDIGRNSFEGTMSQIIDRTVTNPAKYSYVKTIVDQTSQLRDRYLGGIAFGQTARTGLGTARPRAAEAPATGNQTPAPAPEASNIPAGQSVIVENINQNPVVEAAAPAAAVAEAPAEETPAEAPAETPVEAAQVEEAPAETPVEAPAATSEAANAYRSEVQNAAESLNPTIANLLLTEGGENTYGLADANRYRLMFGTLSTPAERNLALSLANRLLDDPDLPYNRSFANWLRNHANLHPDEFAAEVESAAPEEVGLAA